MMANKNKHQLFYILWTQSNKIQPFKNNVETRNIQ